ncbi:ubiquitin carboxyl-terminal hydrolase 21-like [Abrus precatorius]|uniref:Ubiquitin carboxyl-terminal hydrolase n=1 Tax=Abrus precatorius TaxID=3816 RepID=A0A8B8KW35_ABRPR|nr:ubiquitin carboxyl-terminal hydrolase 21-like [Abrus precatorius]
MPGFHPRKRITPESPTPPVRRSSPSTPQGSPGSPLPPPARNDTVSPLPEQVIHDSLSSSTLARTHPMLSPPPGFLFPPSSPLITPPLRNKDKDPYFSSASSSSSPNKFKPPQYPQPTSAPPISNEDDYIALSNLETLNSPTDDDVSLHALFVEVSLKPVFPPTIDHANAPSSPSAKLGAGLDNLGNTCFMSSILQCFTHTVPLIQGLRSCTHACGEDGFCGLCALREHIELSLASSGSSIAPTRLVDKLTYFSPSFRRGEQQDAHEFMQCVLNKLRSCFPYRDDNLVENIFGSRLISNLRCCNCGYSSDTYEPVLDVSLGIENMNTLQLALESFTKVEKINENFKCDACGEELSTEKRLLLDQTPLVAAFHLKRFKRDGSSVKKISGHVQFTLQLDLLPYISGNGNNNDVPLQYDLYAVLVHLGYSLNSGHYFCFVRSDPDKWHKMNDAKVTSVSGDSVLSQEAYILFYAREGTPWFSSIMEGEKSDPKSFADHRPDSGDEGYYDDPFDLYDDLVSDIEEFDSSKSSIEYYCCHGLKSCSAHIKKLQVVLMTIPELSLKIPPIWLDSLTDLAIYSSSLILSAHERVNCVPLKTGISHPPIYMPHLGLPHKGSSSYCINCDFVGD